MCCSSRLDFAGGIIETQGFRLVLELDNSDHQLSMRNTEPIFLIDKFLTSEFKFCLFSIPFPPLLLTGRRRRRNSDLNLSHGISLSLTYPLKFVSLDQSFNWFVVFTLKSPFIVFNKCLDLLACSLQENYPNLHKKLHLPTSK